MSIGRYIWLSSMLPGAFLLLGACDGQGAQSSQQARPSQEAARAGLPPEVASGVDMMFRRFDHNGDGVITRVELDEMVDLTFTDMRTGEVYTGASAATFFFEEFDSNGDGQVTREEMIQRFQAMMQEQG